jgi:hypothetical protein
MHDYLLNTFADVHFATYSGVDLESESASAEDLTANAEEEPPRRKRRVATQSDGEAGHAVEPPRKSERLLHRK